MGALVFTVIILVLLIVVALSGGFGAIGKVVILLWQNAFGVDTEENLNEKENDKK